MLEDFDADQEIFINHSGDAEKEDFEITHVCETSVDVVVIYSARDNGLDA
jgi:hypothetical protein